MAHVKSVNRDLFQTQKAVRQHREKEKELLEAAYGDHIATSFAFSDTCLLYVSTGNRGGSRCRERGKEDSARGRKAPAGD